MMRATGLFIALLLVLLSGCASDPHDSEIDRLWRQGYGFNNPNLERIKNGCPPVDFDGTVDGRD